CAVCSFLRFLLVATSPAPNISGLPKSALYLLWRSTQDESEPVTGKGFAKCMQCRVIALNSTELGAASRELGVTDAKGPSAHHAMSIDVTSFGVSIWIAHRSEPPVLRKNSFVLQEVKAGVPGAYLSSRQRASSFSAPSFQPVEKPTKQQSVGSYNTRC